MKATHTTHTPGPWHLHIWNNAEAISVFANVSGTGGPVEYIAVVKGIHAEVNARLIAMAPRMYQYIATRAALCDTEAKQILEELGYAEGKTSKGEPC